MISKEIQFFPTGYQNLEAAKALSLENGEHFSSCVLTKNISFLLPVTTRQYITTLAQSGNQETDNGESRAEKLIGFKRFLCDLNNITCSTYRPV